MDILKILETQAKDLYPEDLEFFETELDTGEYDEAYILQCREKMHQIRNWMTGGDDEKAGDNTEEAGGNQSGNSTKRDGEGLFVSLKDLAPAGSNPAADTMTSSQMILHEIAMMREVNAYKTQFKNYVAKRTEIDAAFVDMHHAFFEQWELDAIISVKQMGEEFLEKYFDALDHDKLARYQEFSEAFFMKHYAELDSEVVLIYGKNAWRKKENRSKQLDVFLRLKGVKI